MCFFDYFNVAYKNIMKRKMRFVLCVLSISIGISTVVFITTAGKSGLYSINEELSKMGFNCGVVQRVQGGLKTEDIKAVQNYLSYDFYTATVIKSTGEVVCGNQKKECVIYGSDEEILPVFGYNIIYGRTLRLSDLKNECKTAIIDNDLSKKIFATEDSVGKSLDVYLNGKKSKYTVIGVTDSSAVKNNIEDIPPFIFIPHTTLISNSGTELQKKVYLVPRSGEYRRENIESVLGLLNGLRGTKFECTDMNAYKENINYIINIITVILSLIGAISFVAGGLGVINTMMITVSERKHEIGIKKALGQNDISVILELISEAVITMIAACVLGVVSGLILSKSGLVAAGLVYIPDYESVAVLSVVSIIMGIIFGFFPAIKTFFMNPVDILK